MLNIRFKGICKNEEELKKNTKLYKNSVMFNEEKTMKEHIKKSEKIMFTAVIIIMLSALIVADLKNVELEFHLIDLSGILLIIPLALVYEIIIVLSYPIKANKDFYLIKKDLALVLISNSLISKKRYIIICLIPIIVLLVIPYILSIITMGIIPIKITKLLIIISLLACVITALNIIEIYNTLKQVPKGGKIFNYGNHSYWIDNKN